MVYYVIYNRNGEKYEMLDIESDTTYLLKNTQEYFCELESRITPIGYNYFLKDNISKDDFDIEEFTKDVTELHRLHGFLCEEKKYHKEIEKTVSYKIKHFVNKYNLILETY